MTVHYYKALIRYDGTGYFGFQWQKDIPSIQNDLNLSLSKILEGKITTMGASRTDSGVHALKQIVKITSENPIDCETFLKELNRILPPQIKCTSLSRCEGSYKPTTGNISKEYRYLFTNSLNSQGIETRFVANNPYPLNIARMNECAAMIRGAHSFHNFFSAGSNVKSTHREIYVSEISQVNPHEILNHPDLFPISNELKICYQYKIEGNGFLKQMVRHLMSALWYVGSGKLSQDEFSNLLNGPQKTERLWKVASARGLYLYDFK